MAFIWYDSAGGQTQMTQFDVSMDGATLIKHYNEIIERYQRIINDNNMLLNGIRGGKPADLTMQQLVHAHEQVVNQRQFMVSSGLVARTGTGIADASSVLASETPSEYSLPFYVSNSVSAGPEVALPDRSSVVQQNFHYSAPLTSDYRLIYRIIKEQHPGSLPRFQTKADIYQMETDVPAANSARRMLVEDSMKKYERFKQKTAGCAEIGVQIEYPAVSSSYALLESSLNAKRQDYEYSHLRRENELLQQIKLQQDQIAAYEINTASLKRKLTYAYAEHNEVKDLNVYSYYYLKYIIGKYKELAEYNKALQAQCDAQNTEMQRVKEQLKAAYTYIQQGVYRDEDPDPHGLGQVLASLRIDKERLRLENEHLKKYVKK